MHPAPDPYTATPAVDTIERRVFLIVQLPDLNVEVSLPRESVGLVSY